jgi:hypothetical protein
VVEVYLTLGVYGGGCIFGLSERAGFLLQTNVKGERLLREIGERQGALGKFALLLPPPVDRKQVREGGSGAGRFRQAEARRRLGMGAKGRGR